MTVREINKHANVNKKTDKAGNENSPRVEDKRIYMNTFIEAAALFGRPDYNERGTEDSIWGTIVWAVNSLNTRK